MNPQVPETPQSWTAKRLFVKIFKLSCLLPYLAWKREWHLFGMLARDLCPVYLDIVTLVATGRITLAAVAVVVGIALQQVFHHAYGWAWLTGCAVGTAGVWLGLRSRAGEAGAPPAVAQYALLLIPRRYRENLVGDLEEEYRTRVLPVYGRRWAVLWYWWQVAAALGRFLLHLLAGLVAAWKLIR